MLFRPVALETSKAAAALPEDATCVHHPDKRADSVCEGTGDFICGLCAVEVDGRTFSAQHLSAAGKGKARKAFERYLPRPDSTVATFLLLCFVPYINCFWMLGAPVWVVLGYMKLASAYRMRREDPFFARVASRGRLLALGMGLALVTGLLVLLLLYLVFNSFAMLRMLMS